MTLSTGPAGPAGPAAVTGTASGAVAGTAFDPAAEEPMDSRNYPLPTSSRPPHRPRHRVLTLLIVVLLIAVPAAVLVKSAFVSRDSGEDKQAEAALTNLHWEWPSQVQRRVYDVPIPLGSSYVAYYETNAWEKSTLFVQFRTSRAGLNRFLEGVGTDFSALEKGRTVISEKQAAKVGWDFGTGSRFAGVLHQQADPAPDLAIMVDTSADRRPRVYVRSGVGF